MKIEVAFKEMDSSEAIQSRIKEKAKKLERFTTPDDKLHVVVHATFKGQQHMAEVTWHDHRLGTDIHAKAEGHDLYAQIDEAFEKAYKQVHDLRDKALKERRHKEPAKKMAP